MFALVTIVVLFSSSVYAELAVSVTACEGSTLILNCTKNGDIKITYADYGRNSLDICPIQATNQSTNCSDNVHATFIVNARCNYLQNCTIPVNSTIFGDPCPGTSKYLSMNYTCLPSDETVFCGINEHHIPCGSNCQETCNDTFQGPCSKICIFNQCVCNDGYVRDSATNVCVLKNFCPLPGNSNETHEVFTKCGANCEATCRRRRPDYLCELMHSCQPGYVCEEGYLRNCQTGECVLPSHCPHERKFWWPFDF